jgi:hypothetical protein
MDGAGTLVDFWGGRLPPWQATKSVTCLHRQIGKPTILSQLGDYEDGIRLLTA